VLAGAISTISEITSRFFKLFKKPHPIQVAALCYRKSTSGLEILLITSRKRKKWILPKGNPINALTNAQSAQQEAYEEAGVRGNVDEECIGIVQTTKNLGNGFRSKIDLHIYALLVTSMEENFPEKGQRKTEWLPINQAIKRYDDIQIGFLLKSWGSKKD